MNWLQVIVLSIIQGLAELLPVSSSAHVIVAGKFLGFDPTTPEGTFFLVMLHTGTMFAVLLYFWPRWRALFETHADLPGATVKEAALTYVRRLAVATVATGILGFALIKGIEHWLLPGGNKAEIEQLFRNLPLIAMALLAAGILILVASRHEAKAQGMRPVTDRDALYIGLVQGLCLPFRGFSRSGATISAAMLRDVSRRWSEDFSFALAVVLTPAAIARELHRVWKVSHGAIVATQIVPGLVGMIFSFAAGLVALKWLSSWIDGGRWKWFGYYCLAAAAAVLLVHYQLHCAH